MNARWPHGATPYCAKDGPLSSRQQSLRRLDEIERQLDRMIEELRAIGYSVRRDNRPRKD